MALRMPGAAPAPTPVQPASGQAAALPRDPGRATEALYRAHGRTVFRFAWHLLGRREDAEDATQATFLAVHRALASGTAVIEPGAWVLRIARNECMGRLRRTSGTPFQDVSPGGAERVSEGGVESAAELRDELRMARRTLSLLPEPQRDAFVLREWLGLEVAEVSLALGIPASEVEQLTSRARRSLVLAVGGLEPAIGCAATRAALETGALDRAGKVHLLRCPLCRGVRRALQADHAPASPGAKVHARLAGLLPGFGVGGGAFAALAAKTTGGPVLTKAAALIVAGLLAGGAVEEAVQSSHPAHHRSAGPVVGRGGPASPQTPAAGAGRLTLAMVTPAAPAHRSRAGTAHRVGRVAPALASRGGGSQEAVEHGQTEAGHHADARSGSGGRSDDSGTTDTSDGGSGHSGSSRNDGADMTRLAEADGGRSAESSSGEDRRAETTQSSGDGTVAPLDASGDVAEASGRDGGGDASALAAQSGGTSTDDGSGTDQTGATEPPAAPTTSG